jgi:hypothetical protein
MLLEWHWFYRSSIRSIIPLRQNEQNGALNLTKGGSILRIRHGFEGQIFVDMLSRYASPDIGGDRKPARILCASNWKHGGVNFNIIAGSRRRNGFRANGHGDFLVDSSRRARLQHASADRNILLNVSLLPSRYSISLDSRRRWRVDHARWTWFHIGLAVFMAGIILLDKTRDERSECFLSVAEDWLLKAAFMIAHTALPLIEANSWFRVWLLASKEDRPD